MENSSIERAATGSNEIGEDTELVEEHQTQ